MSYISLPSISNSPWKAADCIINNTKPEPYLSFSLHSYLCDIKEKISKCGDDWDVYKKYTNPYEYIHGNSHKPSVCKYRPISRAYFKMLEILDTFNILCGNSQWSKSKTSIKMFGIAEGPGGFIEAVCNYRNQHKMNMDDVYYGMTIEDASNDEVPGWRKTRAFLRNNENVIIEKGADGTGNILNMENFKYVVSKHRNSMDIITGDGGFDFSADFNSQEINIHELLFAQVAYAVCMQRQGGSFILKMFDCFYKPTADIIYILSSFYDRVHIIKPNTSRYANSEKYIVCIGFKYSNLNGYYNIFEQTLEKIVNRPPNTFITGFLKQTHIPLFLYSKIEECNSIIGQTQIENIYNTLALIDNKYRSEKIEAHVKIHLQKCINWCIKHKLEYNMQPALDEPVNIFMRNKQKNE